MHYYWYQPVFVLAECLVLIVKDWLIVFYSLVLYRLEPVQMEDQYWRVWFYLQLFESKSHVVALLTIPGILLIELFGLIEESETVMDGRLTCWCKIIGLWVNLQRIFDIDLKPDLMISLVKEILKSFVKDDGKLTILTLFLAKSTNISWPSEMIDVDLKAYFFFKCFKGRVEVLNYFLAGITLLLLFSLFCLLHLLFCKLILCLYGLCYLFEVLLLHFQCLFYRFRIVYTKLLDES